MSDVKERVSKEEIKINEIDSKIELLKEEYKNVKGTETEIHKRVVGYFRSISNWNIGKKEENKERRMFDLEKVKDKLMEN